MPTLTSSKYHIEWKSLANLPATISEMSVAVQGLKIYVSGVSKPNHKDQCTEHHVFVYKADKDKWDQLPVPDHFLTIAHIIGGKLTLIGGRLADNLKITNKVSTFDQTKQSWVTYYPDLQLIRSRPGVVTHSKYVIVAGGVKGDDISVVLNDIEILDWVENSQWKKISTHLPVPMYNLLLTVSNGCLFVVGYDSTDIVHPDKHVYEFTVGEITNSAEQQQGISTRWVKLCQTTHKRSTLVTGLPSLIMAGGEATADIMLYNRSTKEWEKVDSLSHAKSKVVVTAIGHTAIFVAGGQTSTESNLTTVELGQIEKNKKS